MNAHGLEPFPFAEDAWRSGATRVFGGTTLIQRGFSTRSGDPLWGAGFMIVPAPHAEAAVITMTTPAQPLGERDHAWRWLTGLAEALCDAIGADLAMINGFTVRRGSDGVGGTPAGKEVAPGHPPGVLLPWMYFGAPRRGEPGIDEALRQLAGVAFRSSESPRGGWVLQAHENYSAAAPAPLIAAYATAFKMPPPIWIAVP
jgi:hypothetical protein